MRRIAIAATVLLMGVAGMSPALREKAANVIRQGAERIAAFAQGGAVLREVMLEEIPVYALQLGAYDDAARAQEEMNRLMGKGIPCILWRREQLCIVCSAALERDALGEEAANGEEVYVIFETLPQVRMTLSASQADIQAAGALIALPDRMFRQLLAADAQELPRMIQAVRDASRQAQTAHPENALHTQLAQSLSGWCDLMEQTTAAISPDAALTYAQVTMCTLCRELRSALKAQAMEESSASAQRTPSTAADVMPPA